MCDWLWENLPGMHKDKYLEIPYTLKFVRVKNFEDFKDLCLALKI